MRYDFPRGSFNAWIAPNAKVAFLDGGMTHSRWAMEYLGVSTNQMLAGGWVRLSIAGFSVLEAQDLLESLKIIQEVLGQFYEERGDRNLWIEDKANHLDKSIKLSTLALGTREDIRTESNPPALATEIYDNIGKIKAMAQKHGLPLPDCSTGQRLEECQTYERHGKGAWGRVYATTQRGIVIKITTDKTELEFAKVHAELKSRGESLPGCVDIYFASKLTDELDILWREEVRDPRMEENRPSSDAFYLINEYKQAAKAYALWDDRVKRGIWAEKGPGLMQEKLEHVLNICDEMRKRPETRALGDTLSVLLQNRILLGDLHTGNVGFALGQSEVPEVRLPPRPRSRSLVIMDPGGMVLVNGVGEALREIEGLGSRDPLNDRELILGDAIGVELDAWQGTLRLKHIRSLKPGLGVASRALRAITDVTDRLGVTMTLSVHPTGSGGLGFEQLQAWYERHGFVVVAESDGDGGIPMRRNPVLGGLAPVRAAI